MASLAVTSLREASRQSPQNPIIHYHLGLAFVKSGNLHEARRSLLEALKLDPAFRGAENARTTLASIKG
jgi:Flp pilus assembly protein TadD